MPIDASIYGQFAPRVQSVADIQNGLAQQQTNALALQQGRVGLQNALQSQQDAASVRSAAQSFGADPTENYNALLKTGNVKAATDYLKSVNENRKTESGITLDKAHAGESDASATGKALEQYRSFLPMVKTPQDYGQWVDGMYADPRTAKVAARFGSPDQLKAQVAGMDPATFNDFLQKNAMGMDKYIANQTQVRGQDMTASTAAAGQDVTKRGQDISSATSIKTAGISASASRANNADTIKKDLTVAGMNPDGSVSPNTEQMAQAIAKGQIAPLTGFSLARPAGQMVMSRVMQINPEYDATSFGAKAGAAKAFASGKEAGLLRSIGTANKHLDMVGTMVDALNNGDTQLFNKAGNAVATQLGYSAPTNFNAAKDIVGQEVVKAIVANGGGVAEREEAAKALSTAKSPQQLKGVIQTYRTIMAAQHESLMQQRRAAGLSDATAADYTEAKPAASGFKYIGPVK